MAIDPLDSSVTEALRALRVQLDAGLTLTQALPVCAEVCPQNIAGAAFRKAADTANRGGDIETLLNQLQPILSQGERSLLAAGFNAGCHVEILDAVLGQRELWYATRQKIRARMTKPILIFIMASLIGPLPALFNGGSMLVYLLSAGVPLAFAVMLWRVWGRVSNARLLRSVDMRAKGEPPGPDLLDRFQLAFPVLGAVERSRNLSESAFLLGHLLSAGMLLSKALEYSARAASNGRYRLSLYGYSVLTQKGTPLAKCMADDPLWPPLVYHSVEVGERTGNLDDAFKRMGAQAREDYVRAVENWSAWFPRIIYGMIALFMILNIFMIWSQIASQYNQILP